MSSTRPNPEGPVQRQRPGGVPADLVERQARRTAPGRGPAAATPQAATPQATGLLDPVAIMERYFAMLQTLLDVQREVGLRLARRWPPCRPSRLRR